jgi:hypothetical protein
MHPAIISTQMAYSRRNTGCGLLALLLAAAALLAPPAASRTIKWVAVTGVASFVYAFAPQDSIELIYTAPKPGAAPDQMTMTSVFLRGTLSVPSPSGRVV